MREKVRDEHLDRLSDTIDEIVTCALNAATINQKFEISRMKSLGQLVTTIFVKEFL